MAKCENCNSEQEDFEIYNFMWCCNSCKKFNELPDEFASFIVVPNKVTEDELEIYQITESKIANSKDEAWNKFLYPSLIRKGYE